MVGHFTIFDITNSQINKHTMVVMTSFGSLTSSNIHHQAHAANPGCNHHLVLRVKRNGGGATVEVVAMRQERRGGEGVQLPLETTTTTPDNELRGLPTTTVSNGSLGLQRRLKQWRSSMEAATLTTGGIIVLFSGG
ncbi:unnamed protein product [Lactuca saligna]|uniref:Uncharacterized protein n=1 Tax=Lactuca saligna TaxID=75948 RepID=A0AA36ENG7_LACSI|nr:unnamed protein product [Lactuca saligna]